MKHRHYLALLAVLPTAVLAAEPKLIPAAERVKVAFVKLSKAPRDLSVQRAYLAAFPNNASEFMAVFMPADFGQLYDGHDYISALTSIGKALPEETMIKGLTIGAGAKWDADAPNYLQNILLDLAVANPKVFVSSLSSLDGPGQTNALTFLADGTEGPNEEFITLATQMKKAGRPDLTKRMLKEAQESQKRADHDHGR